jgi:predicted DNA-binding ribbon-helix-helix protein
MFTVLPMRHTNSVSLEVPYWKRIENVMADGLSRLRREIIELRDEDSNDIPPNVGWALEIHCLLLIRRPIFALPSLSI